MADLINYIKPDFSKCGPAVEDIGPAFTRTIEFLKGFGESDTNTGAWTYEWFDCFTDIPLTAMMCCLCGPCYIPARTFEASGDKTCESYCLTGLVTNCVCLSPCYFAALRQDMRKKYNIKGSPAEDLVLSCCLGQCVFCQEAREAGAREANYTVPFTLVGAEKAGAAGAKAHGTAPETQSMERKEAEPMPVTTAIVLPDKKPEEATAAMEAATKPTA